MLYTYTNTYTVWLRATCKGGGAILLLVRTLRSGVWQLKEVRIEYCYIIEYYIIIYTYTYTYMECSFCYIIGSLSRELQPRMMIWNAI